MTVLADLWAGSLLVFQDDFDPGELEEMQPTIGAFDPYARASDLRGSTLIALGRQAQDRLSSREEGVFEFNEVQKPAYVIGIGMSDYNQINLVVARNYSPSGEAALPQNCGLRLPRPWAHDERQSTQAKP